MGSVNMTLHEIIDNCCLCRHYRNIAWGLHNGTKHESGEYGNCRYKPRSFYYPNNTHSINHEHPGPGPNNFPTASNYK